MMYLKLLRATVAANPAFPGLLPLYPLSGSRISITDIGAKPDGGRKNVTAIRLAMQ